MPKGTFASICVSILLAALAVQAQQHTPLTTPEKFFGFATVNANDSSQGNHDETT
ncbi:MAG: hypothetical protein WA117_20615 [Verrucomicrobiia bacterium]